MVIIKLRFLGEGNNPFFNPPFLMDRKIQCSLFIELLV